VNGGAFTFRGLRPLERVDVSHLSFSRVEINRTPTN
jgi:hypothetical protein